MKPSEIINALETLLAIRQPVFLWGAPGVGKSQVVAQIAKKKGLALIDIRAVLLDPVDLRGIPRISPDGKAVWSSPSFLPQEGSGILFLDELNAAPPLVQAACYQLILDRRLGEYELPAGWTIVAAGNRESDKAVTHRMPSALANRLVHLDFDADLDDWVSWALNHEIDPKLIAFMRFRPKLLHAFDPKKNEKAFPSPRSWEFVARILSARPDPQTTKAIVAGAVGQAAAAEFIGFLRVYDELPDIDALLSDPRQAILPEDPAVVYALCESVARRAKDSVMDELVLLANRLPTEFGVLLMRNAVAVQPSIVETPAFGSWAQDNREVLM